MAVPRKVRITLAVVALCFIVLIAIVALNFSRIMAFATYNLASLEFSQHHNLSALNFINESIKYDSDNADSLYLRASIKGTLGAMGAAAADYEAALAHGYNAALANSNAAMMNQCNGRLHEALAEYQAALGKGLDDATFYSNMSDIYYRLGDVNQALECADKALAIKPKDAGALCNRAHCWLSKHQYQRALEDTQLALKGFTAKNAWDTFREKNLRTVQASAYFGLGKNEEGDTQLAIVRQEQTPKHPQEQAALDMQHQFSNKASYARFTLCSNLDDGKSAVYADFLSRFLNYVDANICKLDSKFHVNVFIFEGEKKYMEFAQGAGRNEQLFGNYDCDQNAVYSYDGAGLGAIAHEVMHRVIEDVVFDDIWAHEGIPTIFEKFYGYKDEDGYKLLVGYQNPGRMEEVEPRLLNLPLVDVLSQMYPDQAESEVRLLGVFLFQHKLLKKYLEIGKSGKVSNYPTVLEATFGKKASEIDSDWRSYLKDLYIHRQQIATTPPTQVFPNEADFEWFAHTNHLHRLIRFGDTSTPDEYHKELGKLQHQVEREIMPASETRDW